MKVGIHGKAFTDPIKDFLETVFKKLTEKGAELYISEEFSEELTTEKIDPPRYTKYNEKENLGFLGFLITLGGDGTLLEAVTHVGDSGVPILGVNTGRLGFLATTAKAEFGKAIDDVFDGKYTYDERTLLQLESNTSLFEGVNFALNDFTILKKDTSSMIVVHAFMDGEFLNSYWADGLIVSTPTGSTGYSISCGGPLVLPQSNNFLLTPVSPHNLTVRPIVVPDSSELEFTVEGRSKNFLISLDSRFETIDDSVNLRIKKENFTVKLIKLEDINYFKTLRQKLNWGFDVRN